MDVLRFLPLSKHLSTNQKPPRITRMSRIRRILWQSQGKLLLSFRNIRVIRARRVRVIRVVFWFVLTSPDHPMTRSPDFLMFYFTP